MATLNLSDSLSLSDKLTIGGHYQQPSDSLSLSDSIKIGLGLVITDSESANWADVGGFTGPRDSQDLTLTAVQVLTAKARDSQDLTLTASKILTANARLSQDVLLVIYPTLALGHLCTDSESANWNDSVAIVLQPAVVLSDSESANWADALAIRTQIAIRRRTSIMSGFLFTGGGGSGGGGGGTQDILDWCLMSYPDRLNFHLKGNAESKYFWKDADGMKFWWIKGSTGNPWDIRLYDSTYLYWWITENGDQNAFTNDQAYKRYETTHGYPTAQGVPLTPRFFTLPTTNQTISTITTLAPNPVQRTINCGADNQSPIEIGDIQGVLTGPTTIDWGGSVGLQTTIIINYYYSGNSGVYQNRERYFLVKYWGQVQWDHATLQSGTYNIVQTSTFINKLSGGAPTPDFPCYTQSWWLGGTPGSGGNVP